MEVRRLKQSDDRNAVSRVYEQSWKFAYRGIVPQAHLDAIPSGQWAAAIDNPEMFSLILLDGQEIVGTAGYGPSRVADDAPNDTDAPVGELVSLYLLPAYMGRGHGVQLLSAAVADLRARGFGDIILWVLAENQRALVVYEKFGFRPTGGRKEESIGGKALCLIAYRLHRMD